MANDLPFVGFVVFDRAQKSSALVLCKIRIMHVLALVSNPQKIFGEASRIKYLIPMLLHAPLCSVRKGLICSFSTSRSLIYYAFGTFAISPQVLPASRMVFNRCSSAGVHGVFVLALFGGAGPWASSSFTSSSLGDRREDSGCCIVGNKEPEAFLFRDDVGLMGGFGGACSM